MTVRRNPLNQVVLCDCEVNQVGDRASFESAGNRIDSVLSEEDDSESWNRFDGMRRATGDTVRERRNCKAGGVASSNDVDSVFSED